MMRIRGYLIVAALVALLPAAAVADPSVCSRVDPRASASLARPTPPGAAAPEGCTVRISPTGQPLQDAACTPGAINPTVTIEILRDPDFRTSCVRDKASSPAKKAKTYGSYRIPHPRDNKGPHQTCELDHVVSVELGGADTIDNIWPQCGPDGVPLRQRWLKVKDEVENWLAKEVREGRMDLAEAQRGIAADWSQFIERAKAKPHRRHAPA